MSKYIKPWCLSTVDQPNFRDMFTTPSHAHSRYTNRRQSLLSADPLCTANLATDLLCEEMVHRSYAAKGPGLLTKGISSPRRATQLTRVQGDILPIVKHLAFAGRFRRIDLQPIITAKFVSIRKHTTSTI